MAGTGRCMGPGSVPAQPHCPASTTSCTAPPRRRVARSESSWFGRVAAAETLPRPRPLPAGASHTPARPALRKQPVGLRGPAAPLGGSPPPFLPVASPGPTRAGPGRGTLSEGSPLLARRRPSHSQLTHRRREPARENGAHQGVSWRVGLSPLLRSEPPGCEAGPTPRSAVAVTAGRGLRSGCPTGTPGPTAR